MLRYLDGYGHRVFIERGISFFLLKSIVTYSYVFSFSFFPLYLFPRL